MNAKTLVTRVAGTLGLQLQLTAQVQMLKLCKSFGHILPQVCGDAVAVVRCLLIAPCTTDRSILQSTSEILDTQVWRGKIYGEKLSTDTVGWFRNPKANHRLDVTYKTLVNNGDKLPSPQLVIAWISEPSTDMYHANRPGGGSGNPGWNHRNTWGVTFLKSIDEVGHWQGQLGGPANMTTLATSGRGKRWW